MNTINPYRFGAGGTGLLADYPGAAAAFSLRELSSTWAGQAVIRVQRSGGDQQDFTAAEVTDGTLATFVQGGTAGAGLNDGFVVTWYDQSGNGFDATIASANAPKIAASDALLTVNGEPAILFDGSNDYMSNAGSIAYNGGVSWYCVADLTISGTDRLWSDDIAGQQGYVIMRSTDGTDADYFFNDNSGGFKSFSCTIHAAAQELSSMHFDDSTGDYEWARDGSNTTGTISSWTGPINSGNTANFGIMGGGDGTQPGQGYMQELIIYPNDQSANRTGIESNINAHYGIYV